MLKLKMNKKVTLLIKTIIILPRRDHQWPSDYTKFDMHGKLELHALAINLLSHTLLMTCTENQA